MNMECDKINIDGILLPTTSDKAPYWNCKSITGTLLITVIIVMILCFIAIFFLLFFTINSFILRNIILVSTSIIALCLILKAINNICQLKIKDIEELKFNIESWGQIEVKDIFLRAIEVLSGNLKELNKTIK